MRKIIDGICQWIVRQSGVQWYLENKAIITQPYQEPDRPDLRAQLAEAQEATLARDTAITQLRAQVADLDIRLRRSDPIVQQAVSQDSNSASYEMIQAMYNRLNRMEGQMKELAESQEDAMPMLEASNSNSTGRIPE